MGGNGGLWLGEDSVGVGLIDGREVGGDVDRRLGPWVGGVGRDPSDETKVMSFRDEMRVNERERGKW